MKKENQIALAQELLFNAMNLIDATTTFLETDFNTEIDEISSNLYKIYKKLENIYKKEIESL